LYHESPALDCAVRRYKSGWIPLLNELSANADKGKVLDPTELVPPVDVAWIWHVHRLNPNAYAEFAEKHGINHEAFDGAFQQQSSSSEHSDKRALATEQMWNKLHGKNISFFATTESCDAPNSIQEDLPSSFLQGASARQGKFLWNFLTPDYKDQEFLQGTEGRYVRWLQLKQKNPQESLVPSVPVDLMWHAHMLTSPVSYMQDIQHVGLNQLGHDDTKSTAVLRPRFERTKDLWAKEYAGTEFEEMIIGSPRRGEPSKAYWSGSLSPFRDAEVEQESSFVETNIAADCEADCSSDMR